LHFLNFLSKIEENRTLLAQMKEFIPYTAFCKLDILQKGYLTYEDIGLFLQNYWHQVNQLSFFSDSQYFNLDYLKELGKITYPMFLNLILPQENEFLRREAAERKPYPTDREEELPKEVIQALLRLFENQSELENELCVLRNKLSDENVNSYKLFEAIDTENSHFITDKSLTEFCKENGIELSEESALKVIKKYKTNTENKLSYLEFLPIILQFAPCKKGDVSLLYSQILPFDLQQSGSDKPSYLLNSKNEELEINLPMPETFRTPKKNIIENIGMPTMPTGTLVSSEKIIEPEITQKEPEIIEKRTSPARTLFKELSKMKEIFENQIKLDKEIDIKKYELWNRPDFSIENVLKFFDSNKENGLHVKKMSEKLSNYEIDSSNFLLLCREYNKENNGIFTVNDIIRMFKPKNVTQVEGKISNALIISLTETTKKLLIEVILDLLNAELNLEKQRKALKKNENFDMVGAYEEISDEMMKIDFKKVFFISNNFPKKVKELLGCENEDAEILMNRYDKNKDGIITFADVFFILI